MIPPSQLVHFVERLVVSCEKIATALEGLNETQRQRLQWQYPEKGEVREAIVTRVPTREDLIREAQGASRVSIDEWLSDINQEEEGQQDIGVREREWLNAHANPVVDVGAVFDAGAEKDGEHQAAE
jgi:hypothetical protein